MTEGRHMEGGEEQFLEFTELKRKVMGMRGKRTGCCMGKMSASCLSLGPGETGEHAVGETSGGSVEEISASTSLTELAPRWEHGRWGPEDGTGRTGVGHGTRRDCGWQGT